MTEPFAFGPPSTSTPVDESASCLVRTLGELGGCFADSNAFDELAAVAGSREVYVVAQAPRAETGSDLLAGFCVMHPGTVGEEFFMTRGHTHARERAEAYFCVSGVGILLVQSGTDCRALDLVPGRTLYVPAGWAHRHVNVGAAPLVTAFAVAADAGHDYGWVSSHPFLLRIFNRNGAVSIEPLADE